MLSDDLKQSIEENKKERLRFIDIWAEYVRTYDDKKWSSQQKKIIDSQIKNSSITREEFLKMKGEL
ncbi:MAG: hypothetical protein ACOC32_04635 [Nanoarchaeota archaeon]